MKEDKNKQKTSGSIQAGWRIFVSSLNKFLSFNFVNNKIIGVVIYLLLSQNVMIKCLLLAERYIANSECCVILFFIFV